jgi:hypothetical protein
MDRMEALRLYTVGSSWFSTEQGKKGAIAPGQLADLAVLSGDYFSVPEEDIKGLESVLTIVGGSAVYAAAPFEKLAPPPLSVSPDWSPVRWYCGAWRTAAHAAAHMSGSATEEGTPRGQRLGRRIEAGNRLQRPLGWPLGCHCFAF